MKTNPQLNAKVQATTLAKLTDLKRLYSLKSINDVIEHLLAPQGFAGKKIQLVVHLDAIELEAGAATVTGTVALRKQTTQQ